MSKRVHREPLPAYSYTDRFGDSIRIFRAGDDLVVAVECQDRGPGDGSPCVSVDAEAFIEAMSALRSKRAERDTEGIRDELSRLIEAWECEGLSDRNLRDAWADIRQVVVCGR